jgi:transcriptional regulator with XRE-family HTH domain
MSPLGETLRRARLSKGMTIEDAERVTRIPRKYLEALELENYGILPAPVYARGFLRSYAGYLGLDPKELLPFFPVGHVEEPRLDPLPEVRQPKTWNANSLIAMGVIGGLILIVILLYSVGQDNGSSFAKDTGGSGANTGVVVNPGGQQGAGNSGVTVTLPDLAGHSLEDAIRVIQNAGATFIVVSVKQGDVPVGQVIGTDPGEGDEIGPGDIVTIRESR